ncbi:MAG TPA: YidB family protein [Terriglobales bacterium]|nr:YidB family protein [Terriglobales bacterium]
MSILDSVMNTVEQHSGVSPQQHSTLVESAMQMLGNHEGLSGLVSNAESQGMGSVVQSWIGNGANQSVAPQQVQGLLGQDRIAQLASRAGIPAGVASLALARILPVLVDKLTPGGKLPQAA